jgi:hypothetical protein
MIEQFRFGTMVVDGTTYNSDIKIIEGRVIAGWWRKKGHMVEIEDVRDILAAEPDILVLGRGEPGRMRITDSLRERLRIKGIELIEEKTSEAVQIYNRLSEKGDRVAAGFHLSC